MYFAACLKRFSLTSFKLALVLTYTQYTLGGGTRTGQENIVLNKLYLLFMPTLYEF